MRLSGPPQRPDQRRGRTFIFRRPRRTAAHASGPAPSDGTHLSLYVFQRYAAAGTKARTSLGDTLQKPRSTASAFGFQAWNSLSRRRLPKFDLVALRIHDPTELSVLGVVRLLQDVASFVPKRLKYSGQVLDAIVDHEGRLAGCEVLTISGADGPHGRSLCRTARCVGPRERRASPFLDVDSEVLLVPSSQCDRVVRVEEDSSDTCDSLHLSLRSATKLERTAFATHNGEVERPPRSARSAPRAHTVFPRPRRT